jgi:hypothetical protein
LVGLLGVLVGGIVTYAAQRRLELARERRERKLEERYATAVSRLVRDDFWRAQTTIREHCLGERRWWPGNPMRTEVSTEELRLIAGVLGWDRWAAFSHGVAMYRELDTRRSAHRATGTPLKQEDYDFAAFVVEALDGARAAIADLTGGEYKPHDLNREGLHGHPAFTQAAVEDAKRRG